MPVLDSALEPEITELDIYINMMPREEIVDLNVRLIIVKLTRVRSSHCLNHRRLHLLNRRVRVPSSQQESININYASPVPKLMLAIIVDPSVSRFHLANSGLFKILCILSG